MPKVVNKPKKRADIAIKSTELFIKKGFSNLTISEIAQNAGIAKGTIYDYFTNKEDIIFEIIEQAQQDYDEEILENINSTTYVEDKILTLFSLCISDNNQNIQRKKLYREFILVCINNPSDKMKLFLKKIKNKYLKWLKEILEYGVEKDVLIPQAYDFAEGLMALGENILVFGHIEHYNSPNILQSQIKFLLK